PFYAAAYLSYNVSEVARTAGIPGILLHGTVIVTMLTVLLAVKAYADTVRRDQRRMVESKRSTLERAHDLTDRILSHMLAELDDARLPASEINSALLYGATKQIGRIVRAAHEALEGAFGSLLDGGRVNFEVTFMTRSFRDHFITIPAWANRDGRSPQSM